MRKLIDIEGRGNYGPSPPQRKKSKVYILIIFVFQVFLPPSGRRGVGRGRPRGRPRLRGRWRGRGRGITTAPSSSSSYDESPFSSNSTEVSFMKCKVDGYCIVFNSIFIYLCSNLYVPFAILFSLCIAFICIYQCIYIYIFFCVYKLVLLVYLAHVVFCFQHLNGTMHIEDKSLTLIFINKDIKNITI